MPVDVTCRRMKRDAGGVPPGAAVQVHARVVMLGGRVAWGLMAAHARGLQTGATVDAIIAPAASSHAASSHAWSGSSVLLRCGSRSSCEWIPRARGTVCGCVRVCPGPRVEMQGGGWVCL